MILDPLNAGTAVLHARAIGNQEVESRICFLKIRAKSIKTMQT